MRTEKFTEKVQDLIVKTANEFLGKEELIRKVWFFDAEFDDIIGEK